MISKEFTAYGRRPSISDTCIFIHFNQRFLKTRGNSSVPLKITFFFIGFPLLFGGLGFLREKNIWYNHICFDFTLFLLWFLSKLYLRELKRKAAFIKCQLCARNHASQYLYVALYSLQDGNYFVCSTNEITQRRTNICPTSNSK